MKIPTEVANEIKSGSVVRTILRSLISTLEGTQKFYSQMLAQQPNMSLVNHSLFLVLSTALGRITMVHDQLNLALKTSDESDLYAYELGLHEGFEAALEWLKVNRDSFKEGEPTIEQIIQGVLASEKPKKAPSPEVPSQP